MLKGNVLLQTAGDLWSLLHLFHRRWGTDTAQSTKDTGVALVLVYGWVHACLLLGRLHALWCSWCCCTSLRVGCC